MRALILAIGIAAAVVGCSRTVSQKDYASPEEATQALVTAAKAKDAHGLLEVLGADAQPVIDSGDPVRDQHARERFLQAYEAGHSFDNGTEGQTTLQVGSDKWPFPFPLKQHGARWSFDSSAGAEEIINRRVGENELGTSYFDFLFGLKLRVHNRVILSGAVTVPIDQQGLRPVATGTVALEVRI